MVLSSRVRRFLLLGVFLFIIGMMLVSYLQKLSRQEFSDRYVSWLQTEIAKLKTENEQLRQYVEYTKTDHFAEKKAKEILHRQLPWEIVVTLSESGTHLVQSESRQLFSGEQTEETIVQQWKAFFRL